MNNQSIRLGILVIATLGLSPAAVPAAEGPYHFIREIHLGGDGGWDYLSIDGAGRRLYVSHATKVLVLDLDMNDVIGEIPDTPGVHGVALAPALGRGLTSNGGENKADLVDLATLKVLTKVATGQGPDGMLYDPGAREFYTFNGRAETATVIGATTGAVIATIPLGGRPEFACADPAAGRVYDNLENRNRVAVIDTKTHTVVATWPIAPGESASGMALDAAHHRLFVGCHNKLMVMMDSTDGKVLASAPIGQGVDANAFDPGTGDAFASCGDGTVTIAKETAPGTLAVVQTLATERGARTMALDPTTHRIYLATARFEPQPPPAPGQKWQRPKIVPGTFKILVYGRE